MAALSKLLISALCSTKRANSIAPTPWLIKRAVNVVEADERGRCGWSSPSLVITSSVHDLGRRRIRAEQGVVECGFPRQEFRHLLAYPGPDRLEFRYRHILNPLVGHGTLRRPGGIGLHDGVPDHVRKGRTRPVPWIAIGRLPGTRRHHHPAEPPADGLDVRLGGGP